LLARLDLEAAARIAPQDEPKLIRAIEVCVLAKKPISEVHRAGRAPLEGWAPLKIGLNPPREALYERINQRVHAMLAAGWLDEVRRLIAAGIPATAKPFQFIGYSELRAHLEGTAGFQPAPSTQNRRCDFTSPVVASSTLDQTIAAIQQATRRYAKRQLTWFRREPAVHWLTHFGDAAAALAAARQYLQGQLSHT
jgi:tRNA dimethylallyltransferase